MPLFLGEGGCLVENYAFTGGPYSSVDTPWRKIVPLVQFYHTHCDPEIILQCSVGSRKIYGNFPNI